MYLKYYTNIKKIYHTNDLIRIKLQDRQKTFIFQ